MDTTIKSQVLQEMESLPESLQRRVLEYVQALQKAERRGVPGKDLLQFVRAIPPDDLALMSRAIEEECERVDVNEW
ncbi:MAG: hypothetical protein AB1646_22620 [Thermodesulfobacteriota bacterium]